jgi:hypothetical protein
MPVIELFERLEMFTEAPSGKVFKLNLLKRFSDGKFAVLSCDQISSKEDIKYFLERESYVLDVVSSGFNDAKLYDTPLDASVNFLRRIGAIE